MSVIEQTLSVGGRKIRGALPAGSELSLSLTLERSLALRRASLRFRRDGEAARSIPLVWERLECGRETWSATLPALPAGLYFYDFELVFADDKRIFGGERQLCENGVCQLLVYCPSGESGQKLCGKMIYHIFVDRFYRSGRSEVRPGARFNPDWRGGEVDFAERRGGFVKNNDFFGGDLWGICEKLDYISSLGTDYIYLSPVFDSVSNHKYDTGDYLRVDEYFGGNEALSTLAAEAKKRGMGIILDGVFNHTGDDSVYFNKYGHYSSLGAYQSKESPYYSWYDFRRFPDEYSCWWNIPILPRVNSENEEYRRFVCGQLLEKWTSFGIDGWRLDVPDELSDTFLDDFRNSLKSLAPEAFVIGEVWEDASNKISYGERRRYLSSAQLDSVMNYPFRDAVIAYLMHGDAELFRRTVEGIIWRYPPHVTLSLMNFLGTHDTPRILTVLGGGMEGQSNAAMSKDRLSADGRERALRLTATAFKLLSVLPGALSVYYGDEAGMEGHSDPFCRRPFPWGNEDRALLSTVRHLGQIRRTHRAFCDGELSFISIDSESALISRKAESDYVLCAVNRSDDCRLIRTRRVMTDLFTGENGREFTVMPQGATYLHSADGNAGALWLI